MRILDGWPCSEFSMGSHGRRCVCIYALSDDDISSRVRIGFFFTRAPKQMQLSGSHWGRASTNWKQMTFRTIGKLLFMMGDIRRAELFFGPVRSGASWSLTSTGPLGGSQGWRVLRGFFVTVKVLFWLFSWRMWGCMESNEAKVIAILEVLQIFASLCLPFKSLWLWKVICWMLFLGSPLEPRSLWALEVSSLFQWTQILIVVPSG